MEKDPSCSEETTERTRGACMSKYYKSTITIYTDHEPTRDIEDLSRDAVRGEAICTSHNVVEATKEEVLEHTGEFFNELFNEEDTDE